MSVTQDKIERRKHNGFWQQKCVLCERRCEVNRLASEQGYCTSGTEARVFRHRVEYGEELELIPSHLFYLSGCNLRCAYCIAEENGIDPRRGQLLTAPWFADAVAWGKQQGARNIQWVGGEPTIHIPAILEAMNGCADLPPVVWKSNFYHTPEAMKILGDVVDVFVADFKFGNDECARKIANAPRYMEVIERNLLRAADQAMLIVRHLLLPGHFECCFRPIVNWMRKQLRDTQFNVLGGYLPCWQAHQHDDLAAPIDRDALVQARRLAMEFNLNLTQ